MQTHHISIGGNCNVIFGIKKKYPRKIAYPFDYVVSSFEGIIDLFSNNFANFFDKDDFVDIGFQSRSGNFSIYANTRYKILYVHHPVGEFTTTKEVFERRLERLQTLLNNPSNEIHFYRSKVISGNPEQKKWTEKAFGKNFEDCEKRRHQHLAKLFEKVIKKFPAKCWLHIT